MTFALADSSETVEVYTTESPFILEALLIEDWDVLLNRFLVSAV